MHVLVIPSEEFVPAANPTVGIFQYHQAAILHQAGYQVGVLSITLSFSIPMLLKGLIGKVLHKKMNNATDHYNSAALLKLGYDKMFRPEYFIQEELSSGIPVFRINGFYYRPPVDNLNHFGWIKAGCAAFHQYVKEYGKPDIIHAHNAIYAGMLARKIKQQYNVPYIITEHSTAFAQKIITNKKVLHRVKKAYTNSLMLTAVSEPFCQLLNETFGLNQFYCLPNVLDPELERKECSDSNNSNKQNKSFVFINIAELHPKKNHISLIKAFKRVYETNRNVQLWIGGAGKLFDQLRALVKAEQLQDAVCFLGMLNRQQVSHYLMQADCFVLPSKFETFGVVVIEAMLFGKPVIVTKCGGPESFVNHNTGVIIERENEQQLSDAMLQMINHYTCYKSQSIRQFAIEEFGRDKFLQRIDKIYKKAIA